MSSRRGRWIPPPGLHTPESGAPPLSTPEMDDPLLDRDEPAEEEPEPEDDRLEERLAAARALVPIHQHWPVMWEAGRDAAVDAIESGDSIADVKAFRPPAGAGCRDCWTRGRNEALRVIEGGGT